MFSQKFQRARRRFRSNEDIQVLGGPVDSGVLLQSEGAGNRVWDPLVAEEPQNIPIKTLLICVELGLRRRTHGQGGSFQGHSGGLDVTQQSSGCLASFEKAEYGRHPASAAPSINPYP